MGKSKKMINIYLNIYKKNAKLIIVGEKMDDRRKKGKDNEIENESMDNMYSDFMKENSVNNESDDNDYDEKENDINNTKDESNIDNVNHGYVEKEYKTGSLEANTIVTKASKISRVVCIEPWNGINYLYLSCLSRPVII